MTEPPVRSHAGLLVAACLAMLAIQVDFFSLNLALPSIARDLGTTTTDLQWAISAQLIAIAAVLIPSGRIGDIFGRRRLFLAGAGLFALASLGCGLSSTPEFLVSMRVVQGIGAGILMPLTVAVVASAYADEHARGRAIGLVYGVGAVGAAAGPFIGGILTEQFGWEWVFFFNVPIALGALAVGLSGVPDSRDDTAPRRVDVLGVVLVTSGLIAVSYAFDRAGAWGWDSGRFLGLLVGGIALLGVFVLAETRVRAPLVDLGLFRNRSFVVVMLSGWVANSGFIIAIFSATVFLQQVRGLSPGEAGVVFLAPSVALAFAGPLSGRLAERLLPEVIGALAVLVGGAGLLVQSIDMTVWITFVLGIGVMGLGFGLGWSYASVGTEAVVPTREAGEASGVTLTVVIGGAGVLLVLAATAIEQLSSGSHPTTAALEDVCRVTAAAALMAGGLLLALRRRSVAAVTMPEPG
ncbi:MAG TPA: MFS transporter [Acidimicrobiia bacterium]|nr:MFS transporter [Acidimicrobiia bacterium]